MHPAFKVAYLLEMLWAECICPHTRWLSYDLFSCKTKSDTLRLLFIFLNSHVSSSLIITYMEDWQLSLNTLSADIWSILMGETGKPQKKVLTTSALSCSKSTFSPKTGRYCLKHSMMLSLFKGLLSNCQVSWYCRRLTGGWSNVTQLRRWMLLDCVAHLCTTSMKLLHVAHYIQS